MPILRLLGMIYSPFANSEWYNAGVIRRSLLLFGCKHDPCCVVSTASVYTYQSVFFQSHQGLEILLKPWALRWKLRYEAWCVPILLLVVQIVRIEIALIDTECRNLILYLHVYQIKPRILSHESGWSGSTSSSSGVKQMLSNAHSSISSLLGMSYQPSACLSP